MCIKYTLCVVCVWCLVCVVCSICVVCDVCVSLSPLLELSILVTLDRGQNGGGPRSGPEQEEPATPRVAGEPQVVTVLPSSS